MKAKRAGQIRLGIKVARMDPHAATLLILNTRMPRLSHLAYRREVCNSLRRLLHRNGRCWIPGKDES